MKPLHAVLCALALGMCGAIHAADDTQAPASRAGDAAGGATAAKRERDYLLTLKKCEAMPAAEKHNCIDAARRKYGQM